MVADRLAREDFQFHPKVFGDKKPKLGWAIVTFYRTKKSTKIYVQLFDDLTEKQFEKLVRDYASKNWEAGQPISRMLLL
jgi:hypothetical protein